MRRAAYRSARLFVCVACCLSIGGSAAAEGAPALPEISLRDALQHAQRDAPAVAAAAATYALREAERGAATAAYFPSLTISGASGYTFDNRLVLPGVPRIDSESLTAQVGANLEWTALDAARGDRIDAADAATAAQGFAARATQREAMLLAAELYVKAATAAALSADAELSLQRRTSQQTTIEGMVRAGTRSPVDLSRAKVETLAARYTLLSSRNDELAACSALAAAIGRSATQPVRAQPDALRTLEHDAAPGVVTDRPELRSQASLIESRREAYDAAIDARLPTLGVLANASVSYLDVLHGQGIDGHQYGGATLLFLRWNGIDPVVWSRADVADAAIAEAQRQLAVTQHAVTTEVVAATRVLAGAKIELERAIELLRATEETRVAQNGRYQAGVASLLELLDAEGQEQQARRHRIEAQRDYQLASARSLWVNGRLDDLAK